MVMSPLISICIPCYKRVDYVINTLNSIYRDNSDVSLDLYEVIISDNDPQKEVLSIIDQFNYLLKHKSYCFFQLLKGMHTNEYIFI